VTLVGIFGILLGLLSARYAFIRPTRIRVTVFVIAYLLQLGATFIYYKLVESGGGDAGLYYYDWIDYYGQVGFGVNTSFIVWIVQSLKLVFGGTFLDYFLLFQAFGFFGVVVLMRTFEETYEELGLEQPIFTYVLLLLPSIHYWTASIGKDGLFFFATTLTIWAMMRFRDRFVAFGFAILLLYLVRPHIALVTLAAFALTVLVDRQTRFSVKILLSIFAIGGMAFAIATMRSTFQIDLANANVVGDMLAGREAVVQTESAGRSVVNAIYPVRVFSLLFRPLFVDANGMLGLIVSFENALLVVAIGSLVYRRQALARLVKGVPYVRFALFSSISLLLLLAIGYYNVGLGLRQKVTMILPGILVAFVTLQAALAVSRRHVLAAAVPSSGQALVRA
jgi:hypothetical protein